MVLSGVLPPGALGDLRVCDRCSCVGIRKNVVPNRIIRSAPLAIIGQAPGVTEDGQGVMPFTGEAGDLLCDTIEKLGGDKNNISLLNIIQCFPGRNIGGDNKPDAKQISACESWRERDITLASPKVLVTLGDVATKVITGKTGITSLNGKPLTHPRYPEITIIPVIHPAYVKRNPEKMDEFVFGITQAIKYATGKVVETNKDSKYVICNTKELIDECFKELESAKMIAVDIETSSLDFTTGYILSIGFSTKERTGWCIPITTHDPAMYEAIKKIRENEKKPTPISDPVAFCKGMGLQEPKQIIDTLCPDFKDRLNAILGRENVVKVLHNYKFDKIFLKKFGINISGKVFDTYVAHYLLDENSYGHGLKDLAFKFTDMGDYDKEIKDYLKSDGDSYVLVIPEKLCWYNAADADATIRLAKIFIPKIQEEGLEIFMSGLLMPVSDLISEIEETGIIIDNDYRDKLDGALTKESEKLERKLRSLTNPDINFGSPKQLKKLLFEDLKLPSIKKTEKGNDSTDAEVLEELAKMHPIPNLLTNLRKVDKLKSTYVDGLASFIRMDGRVHASFNVVGAETGRITVKDPPLQTMPKKPIELVDWEEVLKLGSGYIDLESVPRKKYHVKGLVIAPPKFKVVEMDYSQAELRILAELSKDAELCLCFLQGIDVHLKVSIEVLHMAENAEGEIREMFRGRAKVINFGIAYGMGPSLLAKEAGISIDEAKMYLADWKRKFEGVAEYQRNLIEECRERGYVRSLYGRKRRIVAINDLNMDIRLHAEREAINFPVQATANEMNLWSGVKIRRALSNKFEFYPINLIHDANLWYVRDDCIKDFCKESAQIANHPPGIKLPIETEFKVSVGNSWGDMEKVELT